MGVNSITTTGWKEFEDKCFDTSKLLEEDMEFAAEHAATTWEQGAKLDAPKDFGKLAGGISVAKIKDGQYEVVSSLLYSPFMEWGTKSRVSVPGDLVDYASQFRGIHTPGGAQAIYDWCRRVGIPQNAWVFVYLSIMRKGIHPHPFFFKQKPIVEKQLLEDLEQMINTPR